MAHPFLDAVAYPWHRPEARELQTVLTLAFTTSADIDVLYQGSSPAVLPLNHNQAPNLVWKEALDNLARVDGGLKTLCETVLARPQLNARLRKAVEDVVNAVPAVEVQFVPDSVLVLDRGELRTSLTNLGSETSAVKVLLVRGGPKTGKTQGHLLFERAAKDGGAKVVYLFEGIVASVDDVVGQLFSALEATSEIPPVTTTRQAWYQAVCVKLQDLAARKQQRIWIAVDDLGPGPGQPPAPLLDREIREFCDQFALNMPNPLFADWFRLMLIHYPDGDVPTRWRHEFWSEDRTSEADVQQPHVEEFLRSWAAHRDRNLLDEQVTSLAAAIIAKADEPQPPGNNAVPRLKQLHDAVEETLRDLERGSP